MAIELKFCKTDNAPWGFRLTGGADCDVPLTVIKIAEGSIAEDVGLQVDDIIVRIGDTPTIGLTHAEVHDVLLEAGQDFSMAVRRGEMMTEVQDEEQSNAEVCDILENSTNEQYSVNVESIDVSEETRASSKTSITDVQIAEAISGEAEVLPDQNVLGVNFNKIDLSESTVLQALEKEKTDVNIDLQNKKWSTFLQKPKGPKVMPKKQEADGPSAPPYRVIIKKQKKKNVATMVGVTEAQSKSEQPQAEEAKEQVSENDIEGPAGECIGENIEEDMSEVQSEGDQHDIDEETLDREPNNEEQADEETSSSPVENVEESEKPDAPLPLEEQLAQVQQQLQALAQLPSTIQVTLEAVTKQLAKIVRATNLQEETGDNSVASDEEAIELAAEGETMATVEENGETSDVEDEVKLETELSEGTTPEPSEGSQENEGDGAELDHEPDANIVEEITEEELRARQIESEKAVQQERAEEFYQRRLEQRPTYPLTPLQRPIILPGGRRWSQPNDAKPAPQAKSKMTDEKITETLDPYSEIIVGHTKGLTNGMLCGPGLTSRSQFTGIVTSFSINWSILKNIFLRRLLLELVSYEHKNKGDEIF